MAIDINRIETLIEDHMKAQPYDCICADCGKPVELDIDLDGDLDMTIEVPVCSCARKEGDLT